MSTAMREQPVMTAAGSSALAWLLAGEAFLVLSNLYLYVYITGLINITLVLAGMLCLNVAVVLAHSGVSAFPAGIARFRWSLAGLLAILALWSLRYIAQGGGEVPLKKLMSLTMYVLLIGSFAALLACAGAIGVRAVGLAAAATLIWSCAVLLYELVTPYSGSLSSVIGRAAGWYVNPNIAGTTLTMLAGFVVPSLRSGTAKITLLLITLAAVVATFSREALVALFVVVLHLALRGVIVPVRNVVIRCAVVVALFVTLPVAFFQLYQRNLDLFEGRLGIPPVVASRFGSDLLLQTDESSIYRRYVAAQTVEVLLQRPLWGVGLSGVDHIGPARQGPHNMYLAMAAETGLIGAGLFVGWLVLLWFRAPRDALPVVLAFAVTAFFSHNNLDQFALVFLLGVACRVPAMIWEGAPAPVAT